MAEQAAETVTEERVVPGTKIEGETIPDATPSDAEPSEAGGAEASQSSDEDMARRMGWVPKDEYRGDLQHWRGAKEFIERGENELPILKERLRRQDAKMAGLQKTLDSFKGWATNAERRAYNRAVKDLKDDQRKAVELGDTEAFDRIDRDIVALRKEYTPPPVNGVENQQPQDDLPEELEQWAKTNRWFNADPVMQNLAISYHGKLLEEKPGMSLEENLAAVTAEVRKRFPEKFAAPRKSGSPVEAGGRTGAPTGKGYASLPPEAKAACDNFVSQGLLTRDQYVKDFFEGE
jgi:hypothetical protein